MKKEINRNKKNRENEKGAAMVMVLLMSFLLLVASAGLLLETSMNTANITDATSEQQAYNAAESGLQSALNVLRGNIFLPDGERIDTNKPADDPANRINFTRAVRLNTSNKAGDTGTVSKLSRWINYNYLPNGLNDAARVTLGTGDTGSYDPRLGYAYNLSITDPDRTGDVLSFKTAGNFYHPVTKEWKENFITFNGATIADKITITFIPKLETTLTFSSGGAASTNFGSFFIVRQGAGAILPENIRFEIILEMTAPYNTTRSIRGWITKNTVAAPASFNLDFDSMVFDVMGSIGTLANDPMTAVVGAVQPVNGTMTQAEPFRLVVRSVGFGPRGARKELEATVQKNFFNGLPAPATLTLVGKSDGFVFEAGQSQVVEYSGDDVETSILIPPIGTTNSANLETIYDDLDTNGDGVINEKDKADIVGTPSDVSREMPFWLQSPSNLDKEIRKLREVAYNSGRRFTTSPAKDNFGNVLTAQGITFVEGNATLQGNGGGILVVTGTLILKGNFNFNGLIIVTGAGGVQRDGGGTGILQGNTVVAPYNAAAVTPENPNDPPAQWLAPYYDVNGGGTSTIIYNSKSVANGMMAVSNFVLGVAEK